MTSKACFLNIMRENTKRSVSGAWRFTALLCFFLFPVPACAGNQHDAASDNLSKDLSVEAALAEANIKVTNEMLHMYSIQNAMLVFI